MMPRVSLGIDTRGWRDDEVPGHLKSSNVTEILLARCVFVLLSDYSLIPTASTKTRQGRKGTVPMDSDCRGTCRIV